MAVQIGDGMGGFGGFDTVVLIVEQAVMQLDDAVFADIHGNLWGKKGQGSVFASRRPEAGLSFGAAPPIEQGTIFYWGKSMTTIVSVRRGNEVVIGGDGQVSLGNTVMKANARKVRRLYDGKVIGGFAGSTADALPCLKSLKRSCKTSRPANACGGGAGKEWRSDRALRKLETILAVADHSRFADYYR